MYTVYLPFAAGDEERVKVLLEALDKVLTGNKCHSVGPFSL